MNFGYQSEKFSVARRALMLPHPRGEDASIASAFGECTLGLHHLDRSTLDDDARAWVRRLEELMDTTGLSDPATDGLWAVKARKLSIDEKLELSRTVDELAHWFHRKFWADD
jgi:hypothetical protein